MADHHHHIVVLDDWCPPPQLDFPHRLTQYENTTPEQLADRVKDADMIITSNSRVTRSGIDAAPNLRIIGTNATGTNHIDKVAAHERGITVCHVPGQNTDSVAEHAFALYYALRRKVLPMHDLTVDGVTWSKGAAFKHLGEPPRTNAEETLVVVGYGAIGKRIQTIGTALGMRVLVAERKGHEEVRDGRIHFSQAMKDGTVFMAAAPLSASTEGMISSPEFDAMDSTSLLINVGRSGVVDEQALIHALRHGQIGGAATDVFETEPATKENCSLLDLTIPNLVLSPHIAWYSSRTLKGTLSTMKANLEGFVAGNPVNVVSQ